MKKMKSDTKTQHFRDLLVWQKSMALAKDIYKATTRLPKDEMFGLRSQMRRAAVSVPSNIAEGHGRLSDHLLRVFLTQARGSLYELGNTNPAFSRSAIPSTRTSRASDEPMQRNFWNASRLAVCTQAKRPQGLACL